MESNANFLPRIGLGLLRLCTEGRPEERESIRIIHRALDLGIRVFDTADSYCLTNRDFHYGETLLRNSIASWSGDRSAIQVLTKVGLVRPSGKWIPNGDPKHLRKSIEGSLKAFGCEQLYWVQLHVRDPKIPFFETIGALKELREEGKIAHIGLCNVGVSEVNQARSIVPISSIQCELSVVNRKSAADGMIELSKKLGIPFFAYRPLGGVSKVSKLETNRVLKPIAEKYRVTPQEIAIAALLALDMHVMPLVGATRDATLESCYRASQIRLTQDDCASIGTKYSFSADEDAIACISPRAIPSHIRAIRANEGPGLSPEVVIVMGIQGAGKSSRVHPYVQSGYVRLNRDELGGKLEDMTDRLALLLQSGEKRVVLDNTYPSRISRAGIVRVSHQNGVPVRCIWLDTPIEEARINIVHRILERYGSLLGPTEMKDLSKQDPNLPPPMALQKWVESFEAPHEDEGFSTIERLPFNRISDSNAKQRGLLLDVDGTLRVTKSGELYPRSPGDVALLPRRKEILQQWIDRGYQLFFVSNQSGIASGKLTLLDAQQSFLRTVELLELPVQEIAFCPHPAFPVGCFCRKPMPGLGVYLARKYQLDLSESVMVGDMESDREFAAAIGVPYQDSRLFFGDE